MPIRAHAHSPVGMAAVLGMGAAGRGYCPSTGTGTAHARLGLCSSLTPASKRHTLEVDSGWKSGSPLKYGWAIQSVRQSKAGDLRSWHTSTTGAAQAVDHQITISAIRHAELVPDCFGAARKQQLDHSK